MPDRFVGKLRRLLGREKRPNVRYQSGSSQFCEHPLFCLGATNRCAVAFEIEPKAFDDTGRIQALKGCESLEKIDQGPFCRCKSARSLVASSSSREKVAMFDLPTYQGLSMV